MTPSRVMKHNTKSQFLQKQKKIPKTQDKELQKKDRDRFLKNEEIEFGQMGNRPKKGQAIIRNYEWTTRARVKITKYI